MHMLLIEDSSGDIEAGHEVCSDSCHRTLAATLEVPYKGWLGCIEAEFNTICESCETVIHGVEGPYEGPEFGIVCGDANCESCSTTV